MSELSATNVCPSDSDHTIAAVDDFSNIKSIAQKNRFGRWLVTFRGLKILCHDLLALYNEVQDIFISEKQSFASTKPDPLVVDACAGVGVYALYVKSKYPQAKIILINKNHDNARFVRYNLSANELYDATILEAELLSPDGPATNIDNFKIVTQCGGGDLAPVVNTTGLRDYCDDDVDVIRFETDASTVILTLHNEGAIAGSARVAETGDTGLRSHETAMTSLKYIYPGEIDMFPTGDRCGRLFTYQGDLFRGIYAESVVMLHEVLDIAAANNLYAAGLIPTEITRFQTNEFPLVLRHKRLAPVTYPYEWSASLFKKASIFHLEFASTCHACGIGLKDSHTYNVLFDYYNKPYFIDLCSLYPVTGKTPARIAEEFNRYCVNPLYLMAVQQSAKARHLVNMGGYETRSKKGGVDAEEVIPWLDAETARRYEAYRAQESILRASGNLKDLLEMYLQEIRAIVIAFDETHWATYYDISERYPSNTRFGELKPEPSWQPKQLFLYHLFHSTAGKTLLDIGCSAGWFSRLAAAAGKKVIAMDYDESAVERLFRASEKDGLSIHPLFGDLSTIRDICPESTIKSITRFKSDIVLALALIHHLVFKANMAFDQIVDILSSVTGEILVLEFLTNEDMGVAEFQKQNPKPWYNAENLKTELLRHFHDVAMEDSSGNFVRFLFVCSKKRINLSKVITKEMAYTPLASLHPLSRKFGFDRGTPVDRFYIEGFLARHRCHIRGDILEVADDRYARMFGKSIGKIDVLHALPTSGATIVGDLATGENIPASAYDCIILTQTLHCIYDYAAAAVNAIKALKPGGTLLVTAPGISQISRYDMDRWGDYWRFTDRSMTRFLQELSPSARITVETYGNVAAAKAFLDGAAVHEVEQAVLEHHDDDYQVLIGAVFTKEEISLQEPATAHVRLFDAQTAPGSVEYARKINDHLKGYSYHSRHTVSYAFPTIWEIETTNRCAMQCSHCPRTTCFSRELADMDISLLQKILDQMAPAAQVISGNGKPMIQFMHYGEPASYKWYEESIRYAKDKGFKVLISSTSSAFNDRAVMASVDANLDYLWLVFDGMDDETFRKIRGKAAGFGKGLEQLNKLLSYKTQQNSNAPEISVVMIKHPDNRHQWQEFKQFFGASPHVRANLAHFSSFSGKVPTINKLQQALSDDAEEAAEIMRVQELDRHVCYYPWHSVSVLADGRVVPCCRDLNGDYILGDLNSESLADIWNGAPIRKLRQDFINGNRNNPLCCKCREGSLETGIPPKPDHSLIDQFLPESGTGRQVTDPSACLPVSGDNQPRVLLYHRVTNLALDPQLLCVSPENFEAHLDELIRNYRVIPLHRMLEECERGSVRPGSVSVTFDDGYLDNLVHALPLLEKYKVHATIFVTSGMVGAEEEFWWDALERLMLTTSNLPERLEFLGQVWDIRSHEDRYRVYQQLCSNIRSMQPYEMEQALDRLHAWAGIFPATRASHRIVNARQLRQLAASPYIEIGSHAKHHVRLSCLPAEMQQVELISSKQQLEAVIGKTVHLFSYPFGTSADFTIETQKNVAEAGYKAAIANIKGDISVPLDIWAVPRRLVRNWNGADFADWLQSSDKEEQEKKAQQNRIEATLGAIRTNLYQ